MKIGVLGTGMVGSTISSKLIQLGHEVRMGSRTPDNEAAVKWVGVNGSKATHGTFAEAASFGEIVFNCTAGAASLAALNLAGSENLKGKVLVDVSNPLDFSKGMPPSLTVCNTDSLGEQIQRSFPEAKVVKTLNTMNCGLQVNPDLLAGEHDVFMSGNDSDAKAKVKDILQNWFGWKSVIDLGDITTARGTEMSLPLWLNLMSAFDTVKFNIKIVK